MNYRITVCRSLHYSPTYKGIVNLKLSFCLFQVSVTSIITTVITAVMASLAN